MLPFRLSNGICSLNEGVERLVLSCDMEITPEGKRVGYRIYPSVMKSHGRLTYNNVNKVLDPNNHEKLEQSMQMQPQCFMKWPIYIIFCIKTSPTWGY